MAGLQNIRARAKLPRLSRRVSVAANLSLTQLPLFSNCDLAG